MFKYIVMTFAVVTVALTCGPAFARTTLDTSLVLRGEYDDNVFLDADNEQDDLITLVAPGVHLLHDSAYLSADLTYRLEFRFYSNNTYSDETSLKDAQRALGRATLFPGRNFTIGLYDEYSREIIDEREAVSEGNVRTNRTARNIFEISPNYRWRLGRNETVFGYRYRNLYYDDPRGIDSDNHRLHVDFTRQMIPRLSLLARVGQEFQRPQSDGVGVSEDYDRTDVLVGFNARPTSRLETGAEVGAAWLDFKDRDDTSSLIYWAWGDYSWSERLGLRVDLTRDFADSINLGSTLTDELAAALRYSSPLVASTLRVFARQTDYREINRKDKASGAAFTLGRGLGRRLSIDAHGYGTYFVFSPDDEDVLRYGAGASLGYNLARASLRLGYRHERNDSEIDLNDYRSNIVFLEVSMAYPGRAGR